MAALSLAKICDVETANRAQRRNSFFIRSLGASRWKMRGFPIHRHPNPGAAARMIEENEFFDRTWIELAIGAEFQRHLRHPVRLARRVDTESIRFAFRHANGGIPDWREKKKYDSKDQRKKGQPGGICDSSNTPVCAPSSHGNIEERPQDGEGNQ